MHRAMHRAAQGVLLSDEDFQRLLSRVDTDQDGLISYSEFCSAFGVQSDPRQDGLLPNGEAEGGIFYQRGTDGGAGAAGASNPTFATTMLAPGQQRARTQPPIPAPSLSAAARSVVLPEEAMVAAGSKAVASSDGSRFDGLHGGSHDKSVSWSHRARAARQAAMSRQAAQGLQAPSRVAPFGTDDTQPQPHRFARGRARQQGAGAYVPAATAPFATELNATPRPASAPRLRPVPGPPAAGVPTSARRGAGVEAWGATTAAAGAQSAGSVPGGSWRVLRLRTPPPPPPRQRTGVPPV